MNRLSAIYQDALAQRPYITTVTPPLAGITVLVLVMGQWSIAMVAGAGALVGIAALVSTVRGRSQR
jgi:hypothetical protein